MGTQEFGQLIEAERLRRGWTRSKLAVAVGILDDGTALDATQIRRIVEGTRKLDRDIVHRLIQALELPEDEAWFASGLWPRGLSLEGYRRFRHLAATSAIHDSRGRHGQVIPLERRRSERRRPQFVPAVAA